MIATLLLASSSSFIWSCEDDQVLGARDWITANVKPAESVEECQKFCLGSVGCQVISYLPLENEGKCMMVGAQKADMTPNIGATTCLVSNSTDSQDLDAESPVYIEQPTTRNTSSVSLAPALPGVVAESVAWCTTDFECRTFGDSTAICNRRTWQCDCSKGFEHKQIKGVIQYLCRSVKEDKASIPKVPTIIMSHFDRASKESYLRSSDFFDSDVAEAVSEVFMGRRILSHTSIVGGSSVHIAVELELEADDISLTLPTISQKIRNALQVKAHLGAALGLTVTNKVSIVTTGAKTTSCYVSNAAKTVLMLIGKIEQCSALECYEHSEKVRDTKEGGVLCIKKASSVAGFDWTRTIDSHVPTVANTAAGSSTSGVQCNVDSDCHVGFACYEGTCIMDEQEGVNLGFVCTALTATVVAFLFIAFSVRSLLRKLSKSPRRSSVKSHNSDCGI